MILIHLCCGPCSLYPVKFLKERGYFFKGYFYNPNIHPYKEFKERIKALETLQKLKEFEIFWDKEYGLKNFLENTFMFKDEPEKRCEVCYTLRLKATVKKALEIRAEAFTTTLLYSIYQKHDLIKDIAEDLSFQYKISFFYEDFRCGFKEGLKEVKRLGIYLQGYCGCIFSEEERYYRKQRKELLKSSKISETF